MEKRLADGLTPEVLREAKRMGFSDETIADLCGIHQQDVRAMR